MANTDNKESGLIWPDVPIEDVFMTEISYNDLTTFPSFEETLQRIPRSQLKTSVPKNVSPSLEQLNLRFNSQKLTGLESLKPGYKFPHYSQLTEGLVKYYIFLHSQYGTKGKRVSTEKDAAQYKQWTNMKKQILQEQEEFQTFAKQVAMASANDYARFIPGAEVYMNKCLEANRQRVLEYPHLYRMNQSISLKTDPVLPSDPQVTMIRNPKYKNDVQLLSCSRLNVRKGTFLCETLGTSLNPEKEQTKSLSQEDYPEGIDVVISMDALTTLVDNHQVENYPHQWEIPFTVKSKQSESGKSSKTVILEDPFMKHNYHPNDANRLLANRLLKGHLHMEGETVRRKSKKMNMEVDFFQDKFCTRMRVAPKEQKEMEPFTFDGDITSLETLGTSSVLSHVSEGRGQKRNLSLSKEEDIFSGDITSLETLGGYSGIGQSNKRTRSEKRSNYADMPKISFVKSGKTLEEEKKAHLETSHNVIGAGSSPVIIKSEKCKRFASEQSVEQQKEKLDELLPSRTGNEDTPITVKDCLADVDGEDAGRNEISDSIDRDSENKDEIPNAAINEENELKIDLMQKQDNCSKAKKPEDEISSIPVHDALGSPAGGDTSEPPELNRRITRGMAKRSRTSDVEKAGSSSDTDLERSPVKNQKKIKAEGSSPCPMEKRLTRSETRRGRLGDGKARSLPRIWRSSQSGLSGEDDDPTSGEGTDGKGMRRKFMKDDGAKNNGRNEETKEDSDPEKDKLKTAKQEEDKLTTCDKGSETSIKKEIDAVDVEGTEVRKTDFDSHSDGELQIDIMEGAEGIGGGDRELVDLGEKVALKETVVNTHSLPKMVLRKRRAKEENVEQKAESKPGSLPEVPAFKPLIDNILELEKKMAASKVKKEVKNDGRQEKEETRGRQRIEKEEKKDQVGGDFSFEDILNNQTQLLTKMSTAAVTPSQQLPTREDEHEESRRADEKEKADAGVWKVGKLKMCVRGGIDGVYWHNWKKNILPATVIVKLEQQPWFGFEQVSIGEWSRLWINAAFLPHSVVVRGRVHCQSTNIMNWEILEMENISNGCQFQPAYATKVLHNVLTNLLGLDEGSYLLVHNPGDPQAFIYSTVEEETARRFIIYDLHKLHQEAKLHHTPPDVIPWAPLDPNLVLPGKPMGALPCIFPHPPYFEPKEYYQSRRFNPNEGVVRPKKKKNRKNKKKKTDQ